MLRIAVGADILGLKPDVLRDLESMALDYQKSTGKHIPINSAFRSWSKQSELFAKNPALAARPGRSMHNFGYAVDTNSDTANDLDRLGLLQKYRFIRPLKNEAWHLERAGLVYARVRAAAAAVAVAVVGVMLLFVVKK